MQHEEKFLVSRTLQNFHQYNYSQNMNELFCASSAEHNCDVMLI